MKTKSDFVRKWVAYINYSSRNEKDELADDMYKDLEALDAEKEGLNCPSCGKTPGDSSGCGGCE